MRGGDVVGIVSGIACQTHLQLVQCQCVFRYFLNSRIGRPPSLPSSSLLKCLGNGAMITPEGPFLNMISEPCTSPCPEPDAAAVGCKANEDADVLAVDAQEGTAGKGCACSLPLQTSILLGIAASSTCMGLLHPLADETSRLLAVGAPPCTSDESPPPRAAVSRALISFR